MFLKIDINVWFIFCFSFLGILLLFIILYIVIPYRTRRKNKIRRQDRLSRKLDHFERLEKKYKDDKIKGLESTNNKLLTTLNDDLSEILKTPKNANFENFFSNFEKIYPKFTESIYKIAPNLTNNELKLCAFLRLNLSSKEISSLLNITPESVNKARYRLRKKLSLSSKEDLSTYIINI